MRRVLLLAFLSAFPARAADETELPEIDDRAILAHLKILASNEFQGRAAGSEGARMAADYIAGQLAEIGLKPMGDDGTWFQNFTLPRGFEIRPETAIEASRGSTKAELKLERDFKPLTLSGAGEVTAPAVFLGYGIAAPEIGYDDYAGVDVKGKVVIVLRHAPGYDDRKSPFSKPAARRRYAVFQAKVSTAVGAGAAALIIINDPDHSRKAKEDVPLHNVGGNPGKIPVMHVTYRAARRLSKVLRLSFQREQNAIDRELKPRSRVLEDVTVRVNAALEAKRLPVRNICALLEAPPRSKDETLVIGAHFDHVGLGAYGSLAGSKGEGAIHNGADDNGSGSSSLIEVARWFAARRDRIRRNVLFLWFTAEELGLLGSKHYVEEPKIPLAKCVAMVNLDMVGRYGKNRLQVGGTGTSPVFPGIIEPLLRRHRIGDYKFNPGGRAPSDNTSFYEKGMPVLFFFTGLHKDYHRPSDDWMRIERKGIEKVARLAAEVSMELAAADTRPPFTRSDASGLSAGPELGLSFEQRDDGVYVIFVEDGSPADRARFKVGDKIEELEDNPIKSITNFNQLHKDLKPGQKVKITIRRGPRLMTITVRLGKA